MEASSTPDGGPVRRPLIGLTCYTVHRPDWSPQVGPLPADLLLRNYTRSIERAGGLPVLIPLYEDPSLAKAVVQSLDGLVLTGGDDVSPEYYGESPQPGLGKTDSERDRLELDLIRAAAARNLPMLGICRGIQILNAAFGGSLYQDLPTELPGAGKHQQDLPKSDVTHQVRIEPGTRMAAMVGAGAVRVNSGHHQGVKRLAPGFIVSAVSPDGVIEAVERPGGVFLLGVQWHPEGTADWDAASQSLFRTFVQSCLLSV